MNTIDPKQTERPPVRCESCDRIVEHYNVFLSPTDETTNICWECVKREEKGFFAKRDFQRKARHGTIPR